MMVCGILLLILTLLVPGVPALELTAEPTPITEPAPGPTAEPVSGEITAELAALYGGDWYLEKAVLNGVEYSAADMGISMSIALNEDGTASSEAMGSVQAGVWRAAQEGISVTIDGSEMGFTLEDGMLVSDELEDGTVMVFAREAPENIAFVPAEPVLAEAPEAMNGKWVAAMLTAEGETMPVDAQLEAWPVLFGSADTTVEIDGTRVRYFGGEPEEFAFEDGRLQIIQPHIAGIPDGILDKIVELRADGV